MRAARYLIACSVVLLVSGQAPAPADGTITGTVAVFDKAKRVDEPDVWVYLEQMERPPRSPGKGRGATITQKNVKFDPRVLVIPVGATVAFPNKDPIEHNVFSPWIDARRIGFENGRYAAGKGGKTRTFAQPGVFDIYCDIHASMAATIKVVPTIYFAPVRAGTYQITNVPPGRYKVGAWSPTTNDNKSDMIELAVGETKAIDPIHLHRRSITTAHDRRDGTPYRPYP